MHSLKDKVRSTLYLGFNDFSLHFVVWFDYQPFTSLISLWYAKYSTVDLEWFQALKSFSCSTCEPICMS